MHKRTHTEVTKDVLSEARQRRRLHESEARQSRSAQRALAAREQQVADAQRALAVREQELLEREKRVADAQRALTATEQRVAHAERALAVSVQELLGREQRVADAERALAARERNANAQAALERVRLWLPALPKSDAGAPGGGAAADSVAAGANDTQRPAAETLAKSDAGAPGGGAVDGNACLAVAGPQKPKIKITINIKKPGTKTRWFIMSTHRTLEKLMCTYCETQHLDVSDTKFFLELKSTDTGDGPRLVDGCVLHVLSPDTVGAESGSGESPG
jgi:hypothetical protein